MTRLPSVNRPVQQLYYGWIRNTAGASLIEGAIVLPLFILIAAGIVEVGLALRDQQVISRLSREGANLISRDVSLEDAVAAVAGMATAPVNFDNGTKIILSVLKRGGASGTANYNTLVLYQRVEFGNHPGRSRLLTRGSGSFGTGPDYIALNSDTDTSLQVTNAPAGLVSVPGGLIYVSELLTAYKLSTPVATFGVAVPTELYSIAYF
jgi:TadE-like protein